MKTIRDRRHRLLRRDYIGRISVGFTICLDKPRPFFVTSSVVDIFVEHLHRATSDCSVNCVYCFMPEHLHTVTIGATDDADSLRSIELFKRYSGWWLKKHCPAVTWQKSFYDQIVRSDKTLARISHKT